MTMASLVQRYPDNAPGDFYVDRTCIDCDACRRIAPAVFAEAADHSYVARQPASEAERVRSLMALVACPTGSIGTESRQDVHPALAAFPEPVQSRGLLIVATQEDGGRGRHATRRRCHRGRHGPRRHSATTLGSGRATGRWWW